MKIKHAVVKSYDGRIKYKIFNEGGREHYNLGIWIDGDPRELDSIKSVDYKLHPSFHKQSRFSDNRKNNFSINIWTWGTFQIEVTIKKKNGEIEILTHDLVYDLPADDGQNYKQEMMKS